ncbi:MAG TPA: DUF6364 family protein [Anaerolineales bacterium]|nr:DUF6364 family protein [Anaerolineales bacterium]
MKKAKLTVRVPRQLLNHAKQYASANNTTLTRLVSEYLRQLVDRSDALIDAPIVRRLSGVLPKEATVTEFHEYLGRKYGGQA